MANANSLSRDLKAMRRKLFRFAGVENGGALLELAVGLPILLLLVLGVADYARLYYTGITVVNAARAGAVYGADPATTLDQISAATQADANPMTLDTISVGRYCVCPGTGDGTGVVACTTPSCPLSYGVPQAYDTVRVRKDFTLLVPYLGLPSTLPIIRTVVMRTN
jgi:Flp pilus assembly protein TadG